MGFSLFLVCCPLALFCNCHGWRLGCLAFERIVPCRVFAFALSIVGSSGFFNLLILLVCDLSLENPIAWWPACKSQRFSCSGLAIYRVFIALNFYLYWSSDVPLRNIYMVRRPIKIHPKNPHERAIDQVVAILQKGGVIIYPTDTIYALGCDIANPGALARVAQIKGIKLAKARFSFICDGLSQLSDYAKQIDTRTYKILKRYIPGPFTFVLPGSSHLPKAFKGRRTVGIRVPDNPIPRAIVRHLGNPIVSTSIYHEDKVIEYDTDPELICEKHHKQVDLVIDGGIGTNTASTVVDLTTGDEPEILRQGAGIFLG